MASAESSEDSRRLSYLAPANPRAAHCPPRASRWGFPASRPLARPTRWSSSQKGVDVCNALIGRRLAKDFFLKNHTYTVQPSTQAFSMGGCEEEKECFYVAGNLALSIWAGLVPVCTCVWRIGVYVWARVSVVRNVAYVWARVSAVRMSLQAPVCMYAPCAMATMDSCLNSRRPFSLLGGALPAAGRLAGDGHLC